MKTIIISLGVLCAFAVFAHAQDVTKATATLEPKSGSQVTGTVTFTKTGDEVRVVADVQNLKPGKHGIHIHEKGDCARRHRIRHINTTTGRRGRSVTPAISAILKLMLPARGTSSGKGNSI